MTNSKPHRVRERPYRFVNGALAGAGTKRVDRGVRPSVAPSYMQTERQTNRYCVKGDILKRDTGIHKVKALFSQDRQTDRQVNRHTGRQTTGRQTESKIGRRLAHLLGMQ